MQATQSSSEPIEQRGRRSASRLDSRLAALWLFLGLLAALPMLSVHPSAVPEEVGDGDLGDAAISVLASSVAGVYYDDGFYYLVIARRWIEGAASSFDGLHPTNGYQPLWLFCLLLPAAILRTPDALLLASFALQAVAAALTCMLVFHAARHFAGAAAASVAALVWLRLQHTYFMPWSGMEYALNALLLAVLASLLLRGGPAPLPRQLLRLGIVVALCFLARIDNGLLAVLLAGDLVVRAGRRRLLWYVVPVATVIAGYAIVNLMVFGHPLPVSGAAKAAWSTKLLASDPVYVERGWLIAKIFDSWQSFTSFSRSAAAGLVAGSLVALAITLTKRSPLRPLLPMALYGALQLLLYTLVYHDIHVLKPWYHACQPLLAALVVASLCNRVAAPAAASFPGFRWLGRAVVLLLTALLLVSTGWNSARYRRHRQGLSGQPLLAAVTWLERRAPQEAIVAAWNAGTVGFFVDRPVINLDGLVNSWPFLRSERKELCTYLSRQGVTHLVDLFPSDEGLRSRIELGECLSDWEQVWSSDEPPPAAWRAIVYRRRGGG